MRYNPVYADMSYTMTKLYEVLYYFGLSGDLMMKVRGTNQYKDANSHRNSLNASIKRFGFSGVKAVVKNGEVYLVKQN